MDNPDEREVEDLLALLLRLSAAQAQDELATIRTASPELEKILRRRLTERRSAIEL
jgi:hypothetical protein